MIHLETEVNRDHWQAIRRSYESQAWSNAILDSIHFLSDAVRTKTGLQSDATALAGQAFGGKNPKLQINRLVTESERNIQAGTEQLFRGLYQAVRNPRSHERIEDNQRDADSIILFIDYLLRLIGHAKTPFTIDNFIKRVTEESFVAKGRYAALLVSEVPQHLRGQTTLSVLQARAGTDGKKLKYFFDAVLPLLSDAERTEFFEAISIELRDSDDEDALRSLLQLLDPAHWNQIDEVARLRTENRIIRNCEEGSYNRSKERCYAGALSTWSTAFWQHFSLKEELANTLISKLRSASSDSQDFVFRFMFHQFAVLQEKPGWSLRFLVKQNLDAGDRRYYNAVKANFSGYGSWTKEDWGDEVATSYTQFATSQATSDGDLDDDIPF